MGFILFILFFILLIALTIVFRVVFSVWRLKRRMQDTFRPRSGRTKERQAEDGRPQSSARRKKYDKTDGEYVKFEEIIVEESAARPEQPNRDSRLQVEPQISDAEFEEL